MTDSPDLSPPRVSPDSDLDDHRFQPNSLPRVGSISGNVTTRRGTIASEGDGPPRDGISRITSVRDGLPRQAAPPRIYFHNTIARDFENAIADDDDEVSPTRVRQNKFQRSRRPSAATSRSSSPPNSVDAFADTRRRPRAGTAGTLASQAPSFLSLRRDLSNGSYHRTRRLSSEGLGPGSVDASQEEAAELDVCFSSQDEPSAQHTIDFDDLHDFIARKDKESTPWIHPFGSRRNSAVQAQRVKIFQDLRNKSSTQSMRKLSTFTTAPPMEGSIAGPDETMLDLTEKVIDMNVFDLPKTAQQAPREKINRWSFFSSRLEETIHAPELGDLLMPGETFQHLFELGPDGGVWWLDMLMPTEEEVEAICKAFNVHGLTREDIITQETREKVELFKSYYFVCFRSFYQLDMTSEYYMEPVNVYAVVFREGILTFTFCPSPHASNVRKRMGKLRDFVALGADWICYALIDDIVDTFQPVIRRVELESEGIEDDIFTARAEDSRAVLRHIGECRRKVMSLIRLLGGKADVIKGFAKRCNEQYSMAPRQDVAMYLSDIQDHVITMMSNLGHFEKILSRSHGNYLAQISVDSIAQGNRANEALSKVTFIATILVPLNLICGLFGMNVNVPGKEAGGLGWFFGIVGIMIGFALISVIVARRRKVL